MNKGVKAIAVGAALVLLAAASGAYAAPVYDTFVGAANLAGTRSVDDPPGGLDGTGIWADPGNFTIAWDISFDGDTNLWTYTYTLSWATEQEAAISHWILDLSPDCVDAGSMCVIDPDPAGKIEYGTFSEQQGNPGMPANIQGIKFDYGDASPFTLTFSSERQPVWGDFYAVDGKAGSTDVMNAAWNLGINQHDSENIGDFIARPNAEGGGGGGAQVPAPGALILLGLGVVGLAAARKIGSRRR